jgi:hypothetical protein
MKTSINYKEEEKIAMIINLNLNNKGGEYGYIKHI